jgi:hypothetical protein
VAINRLNGLVVRDADVVWRDSHNWAEFLVLFIDQLVSFSPPASRQKPKVGKLRSKGSWYVSQRSQRSKVRDEVVGQDEGQGNDWGPRGDQDA